MDEMTSLESPQEHAWGHYPFICFLSKLWSSSHSLALPPSSPEPCLHAYTKPLCCLKSHISGLLQHQTSAHTWFWFALWVKITGNTWAWVRPCSTAVSECVEVVSYNNSFHLLSSYMPGSTEKEPIIKKQPLYARHWTNIVSFSRQQNSS